jgi:hypothetical protein
LTVEINTQGVLVAVTHWVPLSFRQEVVGNAGFSREKAQTPCRNDRAIWEIRVYLRLYADGTILLAQSEETAAQVVHWLHRAACSYWPPQASGRYTPRWTAKLVRLFFGPGTDPPPYKRLDWRGMVGMMKLHEQVPGAGLEVQLVVQPWGHEQVGCTQTYRLVDVPGFDSAEGYN